MFHISLMLSLFQPLLKKAFTPQRIAQCVMLLFVFQVFAVGLCVPTSLAADLEPTKNEVAQHCMSDAVMPDMQQHHSDENAAHACVHCDLPDLLVSADKTTFSLDDVALILPLSEQNRVFLPLRMTYAVCFSPQLQTSLLSHHLNQRFRV